MDALGLLALGNSSGGNHGSFIVPLVGKGSYQITNANTWLEIGRFDVGVPILAAAILLNLSANIVSEYFNITDSPTMKLFSVPPASTTNQCSITDATGNMGDVFKIKFGYESSSIVLYGFGNTVTSFSFASSFIAIITY